MLTRRKTFAVSCLLGLAALATPAADGRVVGFYRLLGAGGRGYLAYDSAGYMSMTTQSASGAYEASFGTFAVDEAAATITHQHFGSLDPRVTATSLEQRFTLAGNRLTLRDRTWERIPEPPNVTPAQQQLVGFWKLVSTERRVTTGELARAYPGWTGFIVYAPSGHMMVHMMEPYRRRAEGSEYTSYFGTYTITGPGTVVHHMEGSLNPGSIGTDTNRFFEVSGTTLILKPPLIKTPQGDVIMTNVWEHLK